MEHYRYALPGRVTSVIAVGVSVPSKEMTRRAIHANIYFLQKRRHQPYEYCSLSQPTSIRVVVLHPPSNDCLIHCSVEEVDLASKPDFEALSYTWAIDRDLGDPRTGDKRTIICNGKAFDAQKNLYNALIQLRQLDRGLPLWIDAICIDQGNNAEKSVQVNMMGEIYRTAKTVIVWLGRSTLVAQLALKQTAGFFTGEWFQKQAEIFRKADVVEPGIWLVALLAKDALLRMSALSWILRRGWFSRVWTVRESVLARNIFYFLGSRQLPLDDVARFSAAVKDATESLESGLALTAKQMLERPRFLLNARENVEKDGMLYLGRSYSGKPVSKSDGFPGQGLRRPWILHQPDFHRLPNIRSGSLLRMRCSAPS